jgi:hypothetical protein
MASRKDYVAEAASIHKHLTPTLAFITLAEYIAERCDFYEKDNPSFDRERFIAACVRGLGAPVRKEPRGEDEIERLRRLT